MFWTLSRVASEILGELLRASDTVDGCTPNLFAILVIVTFKMNLLVTSVVYKNILYFEGYILLIQLLNLKKR